MKEVEDKEKGGGGCEVGEKEQEEENIEERKE